MTYTVRELKQAAYDAGFRGSALVLAVSISLAENSSRDPRAVHVNSDGSKDLGAWQINTVHADMMKATGNPFNLSDNARMAYKVYAGAGNSFSPWVTYNSGTYRKNMERARKAPVTKSGHVPLGGGLLGDGTGTGSGSDSGDAGDPGTGSDTSSGKKDEHWWDKFNNFLLSGPGSQNIKDNPNDLSAALGVDSLMSWKDGLGQVLGVLTDGDFWKRAGIVAGGVLLILLGVVFMVGSTRTGQAAAKVGAMVA